MVGLELVDVDGETALEAAWKRDRVRIRACEGCYLKGAVQPWTELAYLGSCGCAARVLLRRE